MSLNQIMGSATSGLMVAQAGLRTVSDNVANINTAGYARKIVQQEARVIAGMGVGVDIARIQAAADRFLQAAARRANAEAGGAKAAGEMFDRAQSLFGDPSTSQSFFLQLEKLYSAFSASASDPASPVLRSGVVDQASDFIDQSRRIGDSLNELMREADNRISADIERVNTLLTQIDALNGDIRRARAIGLDASGSEGIQSGMIDELSRLMEVKVTTREAGGVMLRTADGVSLAGEGAARLSFTSTSDASGQITVIPYGANAIQPLPLRIEAGEIKGLLDLRSKELPALGEQLSEFVSGAVEAMNAAHNGAVAVPPPASLTGRNTGLDLPTAINGFAGKTTIAIVEADGMLGRRVDIDFDAGTISADGGPAAAFTGANFQSVLSTALGADGSVSFLNGRLSLSANGGAGVAIVDDAADPSLKAGKGFSHFFGLNDLVTASGYASYDTGLAAGDAHGFLAGGQLTVRLANQAGERIRDVPVTVPPGGTMADLLTALNADIGGVGLYGAFSLDAKGALSFTADQPGQVTMSVVGDTTARGAGGPSMSSLFGMGAAQRAMRIQTFSVRADIAAQPSNLALGRVDLANATAGKPVVAAGDNRGALALSSSGQAARAFKAAGDLSAMSMSVSNYAAQLSGLIGRKAASAEARQASAESIASEADAQRSAVEGVNLDEELVNMTTYQQAFNASARLIQASKDLFDILFKMF